MKTTLQIIIAKTEKYISVLNYDTSKELLNALVDSLKSYLDDERKEIEKAFEDGVGEGMTDPERPFSGREYFEMKYAKKP